MINKFCLLNFAFWIYFIARIAGVEIPDNKQILYSLPYIEGIGRSATKKLLKEVKVDITKKAKDLTEAEVAALTRLIEKNYKIEGELKAEVRENIRRLMEIGSYRGLRHKKGLPSRGQRTRHNARTRKGKKKTVGGLKRKLEKT